MREKIDWFEVWCEDWEGLLQTQGRIIQSELEAGHSWSSRHVQHEVEILEQWDREYRYNLGRFAEMTEGQVKRWCYFDLLKRGAITR